ncbi:DUF3817 domain-containing protein [Streptomyces sp. SAJ15]|uniref:DUF3817 domain-containing protein n=1 Tax=Streptomyces sp. SAJ15 TaxID=2011095 RepID=UPI001186521C|nr:hypothetical protein [Streptomyces sp. SAJ15]TVL94131.1 hypothetical protein CD790_03800 [Streptomyces sp. SAJ15]
MRALRIAAAVEAASILILFVNLFTAHVKVITSLGGPVHGSAYLVVIAMTFASTVAGSTGVRWRAFVPGVGGMLVLHQLNRHPETLKTTAGSVPQG